MRIGYKIEQIMGRLNGDPEAAVEHQAGYGCAAGQCNPALAESRIEGAVVRHSLTTAPGLGIGTKPD
jgi:hypothetical protein